MANVKPQSYVVNGIVYQKKFFSFISFMKNKERHLEEHSHCSFS